MTLLTWRDGEVRDRDAFAAFDCTSPQRKERTAAGGFWQWHPYPWAWEVQSYIRRRAKPGAEQAEHHFRVGLDDVGVAAIAMLSKTPLDEVFVHLVARARRWSGESQQVADEALSDACQWAIGRADAAGLDSVLVWGKVHVKNSPSIAMMKRHGDFQFEGLDGEGDDALEIWEAEFDLSTLRDVEQSVRSGD